MTKFGSIFKVMFKNKIEMVGIFTAVTTIAFLAAILIIKIPSILGGASLDIEAFSIAIAAIALGAVPIGFALIQEDVWNKNQYRLIPISEAKLVLANFLSTFFGLFIFYIIQIIVLIPIIEIIKHGEFVKHLDLNQITKDLNLVNQSFDFKSILTLVVSIFLIINFILILAATINILNKSFKTRFEKLNNTALYFTIFVIMFLMGSSFKKIGIVINNNNLVLTLWLIVGIVVSMLMIQIDIFLLNKRVETKK